jgi:hypothetical protein
MLPCNMEASRYPPRQAAKVRSRLWFGGSKRTRAECPPEKADIDCADAVTDRFNGIEQVVRHNLEYPDVTVEKYTSDEQIFRVSRPWSFTAGLSQNRA